MGLWKWCQGYSMQFHLFLVRTHNKAVLSPSAGTVHCVARPKPWRYTPLVNFDRN